MRLHWHRRDLRVADNAGLAAAAGGASRDDGTAVVPLFVFDRDVLEHGASPRVTFMLDALADLQDAYRERGSDLVIAHGDPREVVPEVADAVDADFVTWGKDYSGLARERDAAVRRELDDRDIAREAVHDAVHHEPGSITTNEGEPYAVYTYFWKKWQDRPKDDPYDPPGSDALAAVEDGGLVAASAGDVGLLESATVGDDSLPTLADLGFDEPEADVPEAGTAAARKRLRTFCDGRIYEYDERRDYPADDCTSRLSAHLKFGTIGIREVYEETEAALFEATDESARESVEAFQSQLAWREFYTQVLWANPEVVTENYKSYERGIEWRHDPEALQAWKDGETGYPIVDAGMRQLREEAWIHNRVRMLVASFLTKDLLIDWREGYDWFREKLVDHDTANDNGGWQWASSTGTDAQPYFRVFNPMTQGERYDPDAEYVREYVPELQGVDADLIHDWHELSPTQHRRAAPDYPEPIVDHAERREEAIATFERARGG